MKIHNIKSEKRKEWERKLQKISLFCIYFESYDGDKYFKSCRFELNCHFKHFLPILQIRKWLIKSNIQHCGDDEIVFFRK